MMRPFLRSQTPNLTKVGLADLFGCSGLDLERKFHSQYGKRGYSRVDWAEQHGLD
jgi:hypothetical protein